MKEQICQTISLSEKRTRLLKWVADKNAKANREKDWQQLWEEIEPYFIQCEGDNEFKMKLMLNAYNYR